MNHGNQHRKLNRTSSHREAMFANMACSLIQHRRIKTTLPKAKAIRPVVEKLVTIGKSGSTADLRRLISILHDVEAAKMLLKEIAPMFQERHGGYLRIMKYGFRYGDASPMAIIEFVEGDAEAKGKTNAKKTATKNSKTKTTKSTTAKKDDSETTKTADSTDLPENE